MGATVSSGDNVEALTVQDIRSLRREDGISRVAVGCVTIRPGPLGPELLVLRRAPGMSFADIEELPSGGVEPGETLGQAVVREMREETGLSGVRPGPMLFEFPYDSPKGPTVQFNFLVLPEDFGIVLSEEHASSRWLPIAQLDSSDLTDPVKKGVRTSVPERLSQPPR